MERDAGTSEANGTSIDTGEIDAATLQKLNGLRAQVRENFAKVTMAMMALPRYRHQSLLDLQHLVLDPLLRDRIALAYPSDAEQQMSDVSGVAIWATVSEETDAKIREQIRANVFPIRLKADEWTGGDINWLLDVIALDQATTTRVLANFKQVIKTGDLRLHPLIGRLVDDATLQRLRGQKQSESADGGTT